MSREILVQDLPFILDGRERPATIFTPFEPTDLGILFVHGLASDQSGYGRYGQAVADLGATALTFDLSGHGADGRNFNSTTIGGHLREVVSAYDELLAQPGVRRVAVMGASYGGDLAARLTKIKTVEGLLLRAVAVFPDNIDGLPIDDIPAGELDHAALEKFQLNFRYGRTFADCLKVSAGLRAAHEYNGEIEVILSQNDELIAHDTSLAYAEIAQRGSVKTILGAGHSLTDAKKDELRDNFVVPWAKRMLSKET